MRTRLLLNVVVISVALLALCESTTPINAQDNKTACDPSALIRKANGLTMKGDNKADMETLMKLVADIQAMNNTCSGFTFTGNSSKLIGPLEIPKGNYKTVITTRGRFTGRLNVLSGSCEGSSRTANYYGITSAEAINGAEAVIRSDGCRMVLETSDVRGAWTLSIAPLEASDPPLK
jgi:hypothetical protein